MEKIKYLVKKFFLSHFFKGFVDKKNVEYFGSDYGGFYLDANLPELPVIIDVGIGEDMSFSESITKIRPKSKIYALDPTTKSYKWYKSTNISKNKNIKFYKLALSTYSGVSEFYFPKNSKHISCSLEINSNVLKESSEKVKTISFLDLCKLEKLSKIDVLKIDIEGSEYDVLCDFKKMDLLPKQICVEFHDRFYNILKPKSIVTHNHLLSLGYSVIGISKKLQEITYQLI